MTRLRALLVVADLCGSRILGAIVFVFVMVPAVFLLLLAVALLFGVIGLMFGAVGLAMLVFGIPAIIGLIFYAITVSVVGVASVATTGTLRYSRAYGRRCRRMAGPFARAAEWYLDFMAEHLLDNLADGLMDRADNCMDRAEGWNSATAGRLFARSARRMEELR